MVDEQTAQNVEGEVENTLPESPAGQEQAESEVTTEPVQPEKTETSTESEETIDGVKKFSGAETRIRELVSEKKTLEADKQSLASQVQKLMDSYQPSNTDKLPQSQLQPGSEIPIEEYQRDVARTADAIVQIRLNQQKVIDTINREAEESIRAYPELDPDNKEAFDRDLSDSISEATLAYVSANPTASVKKFVNKLMKPYTKSLTRAIGRETDTAVKQASETALRPSHVKPVEKRFEDLTPKEMEEKLGIVY